MKELIQFMGHDYQSSSVVVRLAAGKKGQVQMKNPTSSKLCGKHSKIINGAQL